MNKFAFENKGTFILKTTEDCKINNKIYRKGEVVTYFNDIVLQAQYNERLKSANNGVNTLLGHMSAEIAVITLSNISKQESVSNLLFEKKTSTNYRETRIEDHVLDSEKKIYLKCSSDDPYENLLIYNTNIELEEEFSIDGNIITFTDKFLFAGDSVKVFYDIINETTPVSQFYINNISVPFLSGYFVAEGTLNGKSGKQTVYFPKIKCISVPKSHFGEIELFDDTLQFLCINANDYKVEVNYFYG